MAVTTNMEMMDKSYFYWRGGLGILMGVLVLVWPGLTVLTLVTLISIWLLLIGVVSVVQGVRSVRHGGLGWLGSILLGTGGRRILSLLFGLLSVIAGIWLWRYPFHGTLAFVWLLGLYAIISGALTIAMASEYDNM
jgi:uncharacterized membrane protein HdeD (DUF308 family)